MWSLGAASDRASEMHLKQMPAARGGVGSERLAYAIGTVAALRRPRGSAHAAVEGGGRTVENLQGAAKQRRPTRCECAVKLQGRRKARERVDCGCCALAVTLDGTFDAERGMGGGTRGEAAGINRSIGSGADARACGVLCHGLRSRQGNEHSRGLGIHIQSDGAPKVKEERGARGDPRCSCRQAAQHLKWRASA